jgi:two-component system OmpR family response regulator
MRLADFLPVVTDEILIGAAIHLNNGFPTNLPSLQTLRILVIEKDIDILRFDDAAATLWSGSARGIFSQQALPIFMQWQPDVLVSEIALPKEDGYTLIRQGRTLTKKREKKVLAIALCN